MVPRAQIRLKAFSELLRKLERVILMQRTHNFSRQLCFTVFLLNEKEIKRGELLLARRNNYQLGAILILYQKQYQKDVTSNWDKVFPPGHDASEAGVAVPITMKCTEFCQLFPSPNTDSENMTLVAPYVTAICERTIILQLWKCLQSVGGFLPGMHKYRFGLPGGYSLALWTWSWLFLGQLNFKTKCGTPGCRQSFHPNTASDPRARHCQGVENGGHNLSRVMFLTPF